MMAREASFEVADEDVRGIINACHALRQLPQPGRPRDDVIAGLRSITIGSLVAFFRRTPGSIEIVRVIHRRKDTPAVWGEW